MIKVKEDGKLRAVATIEHDGGKSIPWCVIIYEGRSACFNTLPEALTFMQEQLVPEEAPAEWNAEKFYRGQPLSNFVNVMTHTADSGEIFDAFVWGLSKEGYAFWERVEFEGHTEESRKALQYYIENHPDYPKGD